MYIDAHTHIFSERIKSNREIYFNDYNFKILFDSPKSRIAVLDDLIKYMDESNIEQSIIHGFPWLEYEYARYEHDYLLESANKYPGRIIPFGSVVNDQSISLEYQIDDLVSMGFIGIGEVAFYCEGLTENNIKYLDDVFSYADKYNIIINLHVNEPIGHTYCGKYDPSISKLYELLNQYQNVKTILSHWGGGLWAYELMPEVKKSLKNVYYDTAATPYIYDPTIYKIAVETVGSEKIIFGSDYPLLKINRYLDDIVKDLEFSDKENVFKNNITNLLKSVNFDI